MNTTPSKRQKKSSSQIPAPTPDPRVEQDFDELGPQAPMVEHLTIPGFLRRIPHRWHLEDITRFGDKVGRAAESLQLSYMTTVDKSLGVIRVFPAPLLQRIYEILAVQFGWPRIIEAEPPTLDDPRRVQQETLRSHERMTKHLQTVLGSADSDDMDLQHSVTVILQWLDKDSRRIREQLGIPENASGRE